MTTESPSLDGARFAQQLRTGDRAALEWLVGRCERVGSRQFSGWAWRWIREDFVADLAAQLTSASRATTFEIRGAAEPYVDTAIRNLCRRYYLDLARVRSQVPMDAVTNTPAGPTDSLARIAAVLDVKRVLRELSPECRRLIEDKYGRNLSLEEMGRERGIPEKTARSRLHACREKLRARWRELSTR